MKRNAVQTYQQLQQNLDVCDQLCLTVTNIEITNIRNNSKIDAYWFPRTCKATVIKLLKHLKNKKKT
jgi:hypothetical protein